MYVGSSNNNTFVAYTSHLYNLNYNLNLFDESFIALTRHDMSILSTKCDIYLRKLIRAICRKASNQTFYLNLIEVNRIGVGLIAIVNSIIKLKQSLS